MPSPEDLGWGEGLSLLIHPTRQSGRWEGPKMEPSGMALANMGSPKLEEKRVG